MTPDRGRETVSADPLTQQSVSQVDLVVYVPGDPAPQGSKRYLGKGVSIEQSKKLHPWRADVRGVVMNAWKGHPIQWAVSVRLHFVMPRPLSTPKKGPTPPAVKKADIDKLSRAVLDALTSAGVWYDDKQVCELLATKRLAERGEVPGCQIYVRPVMHDWTPEGGPPWAP